MKKFIAVITAALCAASAAAFAACSGEKDSDEVTAEEWESAMTASNGLNVTLSGTYTQSATTTYSGVTTTTNGVADVVIKTALSISGTAITGTTYMYASTNATSGNESEDTTITEYENFLGSSYSYVAKMVSKTVEENSSGELEESNDVEWEGKTYSTAATPSSSDAYTSIKEFITMISGEYDEFEYVDGAYRYYPDGEDTSNVAYVKINDGKLTSLVLESTDAYTIGDYSRTTSAKYDFKLYDYGKTSVSIPEEFTYEYYYLNHVL